MLEPSPSNRVALLSGALEDRTRELTEAEARHSSATEALRDAEEKLAGAEGSPITAWTGLHHRRNYQQHQLEFARTALETARSNLACASQALEVAQREAKIAELRELGSIARYQNDTAAEAKVLLDALDTARAAASRIDERWKQIPEASAELRKLGAPGIDADFAVRLSPVFKALLDSNPDIGASVLGRNGHMVNSWDGLGTHVIRPLQEHGLAGFISERLFKTEPVPPEHRHEQMRRMGFKMPPFLATEDKCTGTSDHQFQGIRYRVEHWQRKGKPIDELEHRPCFDNDEPVRRSLLLSGDESEPQRVTVVSSEPVTLDYGIPAQLVVLSNERRQLRAPEPPGLIARAVNVVTNLFDTTDAPTAA